MNIENNIWMIQIPDNEVSQHYVKQVLPSWNNINMFDAVTPDNLPNYLEFGKFWGFRDFSETEKAGFYSHLALWQKCFYEDKPIAIIEHDVICNVKEMPIIGEFFSFCDFNSNDEWQNYSKRFQGHPYWGQDEPLCPVTHAYYMTPDVAESLFYTISESPIEKFVDDYMWEFMGKDKSKIVNYTSPIYNADVGGTMIHE